MDQEFEKQITEWPLLTIRDVDLATLFLDDASRRYAAVNRALKKGSLIRLRRGVYLIGKPYKQEIPNSFEIAHTLYGPSYISFESALSYHNLIPEAVYTTTCATSKRSNSFDTPLGQFQFTHVPENLFYLGVKREKSGYIAEPWKAIADHYYAFKRDWNSLKDLTSDLRIEREYLLNCDINTLKVLVEHYQSKRVRLFLTKILKEIE